MEPTGNKVCPSASPYVSPRRSHSLPAAHSYSYLENGWKLAESSAAEGNWVQLADLMEMSLYTKSLPIDRLEGIVNILITCKPSNLASRRIHQAIVALPQIQGVCEKEPWKTRLDQLSLACLKPIPMSRGALGQKDPPVDIQCGCTIA